MSKYPVIIMISGVPATGKSTLAIHLAYKLNFKVALGIDEIKEVVKLYDFNPFIHRSSHDCWELLGERDKKNIIRGFRNYCLGFEKAVKSIFKRSEWNGENAIIEGVHLLPGIYTRRNEKINLFHFVIISKFGQKRKGKIKSKINERHNRQKDVWSKRDCEIKLIQELLLKQARNSGCILLEEGDTRTLVRNIINHIGNHEIK